MQRGRFVEIGRAGWCVQDSAVFLAGESVARSELALSGRMNHMNLVTAGALAFTGGALIDSLVHVAKKYTGLPHRTQLVAEIDSVRYINDSKATNVAATCAAISSLGSEQNNIVLLAGGDAKNAIFDELTETVKRNVKQAVLFGRDASRIGSAIQGAATFTYAENLLNAVEIAHATADAGDVVLLSPACASFDMFDDYQDRGHQFEEIVRSMAV